MHLSRTDPGIKHENAMSIFSNVHEIRADFMHIFSKLSPPDLAIIFYCHIRTREFFKIATNRSGNFSKLSPPDLAIIFYRRVRGRGAPSEISQNFRIFPAKLPQTDPAIIFYCHLRIREFFKIATNRSGNFSKLSHPDAGIIFYWRVRSWGFLGIVNELP